METRPHLKQMSKNIHKEKKKRRNFGGCLVSFKKKKSLLKIFLWSLLGLYYLKSYIFFQWSTLYAIPQENFFRTNLIVNFLCYRDNQQIYGKPTIFQENFYIFYNTIKRHILKFICFQFILDSICYEQQNSICRFNFQKIHNKYYNFLNIIINSTKQYQKLVCMHAGMDHARSPQIQNGTRISNHTSAAHRCQRGRCCRRRS